jgi:glycosyltransferase involved in cell wall biosynthesis
MTTVIDELTRLKLPNVHIVDRSLASDEYQWLLQSADVVLLPYDAGTYRARTSGPFVEAICAGKAVIVPEGSWMSTQLGKSGAGLTFRSGFVQDLVRATTQLLARRSEFIKAAEELGQHFRKIHNPQSFVSSVLGAESSSLPPV